MDKIKRLKDILAGLGKVVVAYSGGLDSTFLIKTAVDTLGRENVIAVTARSETYPYSEFIAARSIAKKIGVKQLVIQTAELKDDRFRSNPVDRCYYCKKELFTRLDYIRKAKGFYRVLDGTNYDDMKDIRYGRKAALGLGVRSPLLEARMTKADIRKYSKGLKLTTWDKPSMACLASRIPFESAITVKDLNRIDRAEAYLSSLGFKQVRVRLHGEIARVEVLKRDFAKAIRLSEVIVRKLRAFGFVYVTLDLMGYRTGSMHEGV